MFERFRILATTVLSMALLFALLMWERTRPLAVVAIGILIVIAFIFAVRAAIVWKREARELGEYAAEVSLVCPQCGYDLRGTPARCPECGREVQTGETTVQSNDQTGEQSFRDREGAKADAKTN